MLTRLNRGCVLPSYDWLAEPTGLSRATIARSCCSRWRASCCDSAASSAPKAKGARAGAGEAPRWLRPAPVPDDALQREADRCEAEAAMRAGLSCRDLPQATVGDALGRMLARLGARIDAACEAKNHAQPLTKSFIIMENGVDLDGQHDPRDDDTNKTASSRTPLHYANCRSAR